MNRKQTLIVCLIFVSDEKNSST